ncbi:MAG: YXWGXW repeat-containing protein [candidate division Zixibacteria bacterium]|nr:YXWGXW repeat-containing protein [candidate division Zixibacteria bacterium]
MKKVIVFILAVMVLFAFLLGCTKTVYVTESPPPAKAEVKTPAPGPKAVWIEGHWKRSHGRYVWVPGHWVKKPHGKWVSGHWEKRPRGWVWVKGHWRR